MLDSEERFLLVLMLVLNVIGWTAVVVALYLWWPL